MNDSVQNQLFCFYTVKIILLGNPFKKSNGIRSGGRGGYRTDTHLPRQLLSKVHSVAVVSQRDQSNDGSQILPRQIHEILTDLPYTSATHIWKPPNYWKFLNETGAK